MCPHRFSVLQCKRARHSFVYIDEAISVGGSGLAGPLFGNRGQTAEQSTGFVIGPWVASTAETVHTATMTLKNAATLALIGTFLLTVLLAIDFINSFLAASRGLTPAMAVLRILIYLFASLTVTVFFYVFNRAQSR